MNVGCQQCVVSLKVHLLLLVIIIQPAVIIGLVAEIFIPNYQSLFFKFSQRNLGKRRLSAGEKTYYVNFAWPCKYAVNWEPLLANDEFLSKVTFKLTLLNVLKVSNLTPV